MAQRRLRHGYPIGCPALTAALLFGPSTPLAKWLGTDLSPLLLADLLYLSIGAGLALVIAIRHSKRRAHPPERSPLSIPRSDVPWLAGAIVAGGVIGPALLMTGLQSTGGASAALLLNLEGVLTALLAWIVFEENADRRVVLGMPAIVAGGVLLVWQPGHFALSSGSLLVAGACFLGGRQRPDAQGVGDDAMLLVCLDGLVAGICIATLALIGRRPLGPTQGSRLGVVNGDHGSFAKRLWCGFVRTPQRRFRPANPDNYQTTLDR